MAKAAPKEASSDEVPPHFDSVDLTFGLLRAGAALSGLAYTWLSPSAEPVRGDLSIAFGVFLAYTVIVYAGGWTLFETRMKPRFYATTAALDFGFVVVLLLLTGGGASPMYRALYVWVAVVAFYFGQKGGGWASAIAFFAFAWFFWADEDPPDMFNLLAKAGGLILHGPLIGWLVDRERRHVAQLRRALAKLRDIEKAAD